MPPISDVTGLLQAWQAGDEHALDKLMVLLYQELHRATNRYIVDERPSHTLQTAALNISMDTVERDWKFSRSWLRKELGRGDRNGA